MRRLSVLAAVALFGALFAAAGPASAGGSCFEPSHSWAGVAVDLKGICFWPTVLYVDPGTKVTWTNREVVDHTVTGLGDQWGSHEALVQGASISYRFAKAGVYPYACIIHPGMVAAVVVGKPGPGPTPAELVVPAEVLPSSTPVVERAPALGSSVRASAPRTASRDGWQAAAMVGWSLFVLTSSVMAVARARRRHVPEAAA
jgi:plastocyanin